MVFYATEPEPDSIISAKTINNEDGDIGQNQNLMFDFHVDYTRAPEVDSDGDEDLTNLETRTVHNIHQFDKDWLIGGDEDQIQAIVYHILDLIEAPCYNDIVRTLTDDEILDLKELDAISPLRNVERIKVTIDVIAWTFPGESDDVEVKLAVAPASDEAVKTHLETVMVENEGYCVICMDKIRVGSNVAAGRMPCLHVFHRMCGEEWLKNNGVCPVCRAVFPS